GLLGDEYRPGPTEASSLFDLDFDVRRKGPCKLSKLRAQPVGGRGIDSVEGQRSTEGNGALKRQQTRPLPTDWLLRRLERGQDGDLSRMGRPGTHRFLKRLDHSSTFPPSPRPARGPEAYDIVDSRLGVEGDRPDVLHDNGCPRVIPSDEAGHLY